MKSCWLQGRGRKMMSGRGSAFSQGGGESEGGGMEREGKGRRKRPAPAAAGGAGEVAQDTHGDGPESKRERVDQGEAGDERREGGVELPEPSMDLGTGAVAKEDVDRRVEREEVDHELKDLQHLVKTRGYIAQLEQDVKGLREELDSAGPEAEAPGMQGGGGMEGDNICPSPTLAGRKRQRGESDVQGREDAGKSMCTALEGPRKVPSHDSAVQELPGADLGSGPRWDLRPGIKKTLRAKDMDALEEENKRLLKRCEAMLEHALSGSEHGDVRFVLEDGSSPLSGHRAVLCAVSEEYAGMFRSGMVEGKEGKIRVPPGVSLQAYRGLLEFVYLGRGGRECAKADGRELWVLGELYEVAVMRDWLLDEGIHGGNFGAAYEFWLVPEGVEREAIMAKCMSIIQPKEEEGGEMEVDEAGLQGVGREAAKNLALTRASQGEGRRRGWRCVRDGFRVLEAWVRANGAINGWGNEALFRELIGELDLLRIPFNPLRDPLGGCGYLDGAWISGVLERKQAAGENALDVEIKTAYKVERQYDLGGDFGSWGPGKLALHGKGSEQRMAIIDESNHRVVIVNVESGERLATVGSEGRGPGEFTLPSGIAFSDAGELYVCSFSRDNWVQVFDRQGRRVRGFGRWGYEKGEFREPSGLCFTADGNLVVIDRKTHRVQIYREDGTFVRAFGSKGRGDGEFESLTDVCPGADGSIAILDGEAGRVMVFDGEGVFLRSFGHMGTDGGPYTNLDTLAAGEDGEIIIVSKYMRKDLQILSPEGELVQTITTESLVVDMSTGVTIQDRASRLRRVGGVATVDGVMYVSMCSAGEPECKATVAMLS